MRCDPEFLASEFDDIDSRLVRFEKFVENQDTIKRSVCARLQNKGGKKCQ